MTKQEMENFIATKNYDVRISRNGRWIDQKCTPDVLWSVSDFVLNYVDEVKDNIYQAMIAEKFNKKIDELTKELRKDAKIVIK